MSDSRDLNLLLDIALRGWLFIGMQKLGYPGDSEGVCYGVAHMGVHAIHDKALKRFDARLALIKQLVEEGTLVAKIAEIRQLQRKSKTTLTDPIIEIPAFIEGVELYMNPYIYSRYFEKQLAPKTQHGMMTAPVVRPKELGAITEVEKFTGVYTKEELVLYFQALREAVKKYNFKEPISLVLTSGGHAITVGYSPVEDEWQLINSADFPTKYIKSTQEIAEEACGAFSKNSVAAIATHFIGLARDEEKLKAIITMWQEQIASLHTVTPQKAVMTDSHATSWLYLAAAENQYDLVKTLVENDADVNAAMKSGSSPLHVAVQFGCSKIVKFLLDHQANANIEKKNGVTPLFIAALQGYLDIFNELKANGADDKKIWEGANLLCTAASRGHADLVEALLNDDADVIDQPILSTGETPLFLAAMGGYIEAVNILLARGANANQATIKGVTPLYIAAQYGFADIIEALVAKNADVNTLYQDSSPLYIAAQNNHVAATRVLLANSANANIARKNGATPLFIAAQNGSFEVCQLLISHGASLTQSFVSTNTDLRAFAEKQNVEERMEEIIMKKNPANLPTIEMTPREIAYVMGHTKIEEFLRQEEEKALAATTLVEEKTFALETDKERPLTERWAPEESKEVATFDEKSIKEKCEQLSYLFDLSHLIKAVPEEAKMDLIYRIGKEKLVRLMDSFMRFDDDTKNLFFELKNILKLLPEENRGSFIEFIGHEYFADIIKRSYRRNSLSEIPELLPAKERLPFILRSEYDWKEMFEDNELEKEKIDNILIELDHIIDVLQQKPRDFQESFVNTLGKEWLGVFVVREMDKLKQTLPETNPKIVAYAALVDVLKSEQAEAKHVLSEWHKKYEHVFNVVSTGITMYQPEKTTDAFVAKILDLYGVQDKPKPII